MLLVHHVCILYKVAIEKKSALTSGTPDGSGDVRRDKTDENPKRDFGPHGSPWTLIDASSSVLITHAGHWVSLHITTSGFGSVQLSFLNMQNS